MIYALVRFLFVPFFYLAYRPRVIGAKNMRVKGKAVYVCNHISMMDPVTLALISPRFIHFMAKASLFKSRLMNVVLRSALAFPIERQSVDMVSLKKAMKVLDEGKVFGIFAEGHRSITGELDALEKGAAFLAARANAPIIPMCIRPDSYRRWKIIVVVGETIHIDKLKETAPKGKLIDTITSTIEDSFKSLLREVNA